jgi:hypothetical protein
MRYGDIMDREFHVLITGVCTRGHRVPAGLSDCIECPDSITPKEERERLMEERRANWRAQR